MASPVDLGRLLRQKWTDPDALAREIHDTLQTLLVSPEVQGFARPAVVSQAGPGPTVAPFMARPHTPSPAQIAEIRATIMAPLPAQPIMARPMAARAEPMMPGPGRIATIVPPQQVSRAAPAAEFSSARREPRPAPSLSQMFTPEVRQAAMRRAMARAQTIDLGQVAEIVPPETRPLAVPTPSEPTSFPEPRGQMAAAVPPPPAAELEIQTTAPPAER